MRSASLSLLAFASLASAWSTFTVPHTDGVDDVPALMAAIGNFSTNATILFKKGVTYNLFSAIKFPTLTNVVVSIQGNLTYPSDIATVQGTSQILYHSV